MSEVRETKVVDWRLIYLEDNPFLVEPPSDPHQVRWAGMRRLKQSLDEVFAEAQTTSRTQVVLNRGIIGAGKTHASLFYSLPENMPLTKGSRVRKIYSVRVTTPKEPAQAVSQLYRQILEQLTITEARNTLQTIAQQEPQQDFLSKFQRITRSEEFAKAFWLLASSNDEDAQRILRRYFLLSRTTTLELRKLDVGRSIDSLLDQTSVLAAFLHSFIGLDSDMALEKHARVSVWIDEMEDLVYYPAREHRMVSQALRDLIDRIPNYFSLFMNFTMTLPEREEEIDVILGGYVKDRITKTVVFAELDVESGVDYVEDLLTQYRTADFAKNLPKAYPFESGALRELISKLPRRTPRSINKACYDVVIKAFNDGLLEAKGQTPISTSYVGQFAVSREASTEPETEQPRRLF